MANSLGCVGVFAAGPDGTGVDRRIPFPEFDFNDSYQRFGESSVLNIGELLGPTLRVEVGGTLTEEDASVVRSPKRFRADITGGGLCLGSLPCAPLPIKGVGLFDGVYLGRRLRRPTSTAEERGSCSCA